MTWDLIKAICASTDQKDKCGGRCSQKPLCFTHLHLPHWWAKMIQSVEAMPPLAVIHVKDVEWCVTHWLSVLRWPLALIQCITRRLLCPQIHCADHLSWHHGPWRGQTETHRRQNPWILFLKCKELQIKIQPGEICPSAVDLFHTNRCL